MKTVIVACGAGVATSTILTEKVRNLLNEHGIPHRIIQISLNEVNQYIDQGDLVVSSMQIYQQLPIPKVLGVSYLTGVNEDKTNQEIIEALS